MPLPFPLVQAIQNGNCVLFVGAGIGLHFKKEDGSPAPNGWELTKLVKKEFGIDEVTELDLAKACEWVDIKKGRPALEKFIKKHLGKLTPDETFRWISTVKWKSVFTTNYDDCIEIAYEKNSHPAQNPIPVAFNHEIRPYDPNLEVPIFHIHGRLSDTRSQIIISETDYARFSENRRMVFNYMRNEFATSTFLYVGYKNEDFNWKQLLDETMREFLPATLPNSYRIDPFSNEISNDILKSKNIETIGLTFSNFVDAAKRESESLSVDESQKIRYKKIIPEELYEKFEQNPVPTSRLLNSWEFLNKSSFSEKSNFSSFLKGDKPNWGLIASDEYFKRDLSEEINEYILDFATTHSLKVTPALIQSPAGYGISTLLMISAKEIVKENAGLVFYLRPGKKILQGDLEYAITLGESVFFIVDNAADHAPALSDAISVLRSQKKRCFFLLGERVNEWKQRTAKPKCHEFLLPSLSDQEINALLELLQNKGALNKLEDLEPQHRFKIIKDKNQKDLLVTLRESIENNNFNVILEDEYRGIKDPLAQRAYVVVCIFHQLSVSIRDDLFSDILGVSLVELHESLNKYAEGIISFECYDLVNQKYAARSRHPTIANYIWNHCSYSINREDVIIKCLSKLNLRYYLDSHAFEQLVRYDLVVDSFRTFEDKVRFFDEACKKDPADPYVRQHYSRMLLRSQRLPMALLQIDEAIRMDNKFTLRVLYNTRGNVYAAMAMDSDSLEIGRKYLFQAEKNFRSGIGIRNTDDYGWTGLANLFIDWAIKIEAASEVEQYDYLKKAEEVITTGLSQVKNKDGLNVASSKIQHILGNKPSAIQILETSLQAGSSSVITRYLLAKNYRRIRNYPKAMETLEPIITSNYSEYRSFMEYAHCLIAQGENYRRAHTYLELCKTHGYNDPEFIAMFGGCLYLDGQFPEARNVFSICEQRDFPIDEVTKMSFFPLDFTDRSRPLLLVGKVVAVKSAFSFAEANEYANILCPSSKYRGVPIKNGMSIKFQLCFTARGPIADNITAN